ncbi:MAG: AAA family ATPase [Chloroflexota bacterium]
MMSPATNQLLQHPAFANTRAHPSAATVKQIPYGISDFGRLRAENGYYVDKTPFILLIEQMPLYLFCLRPRRSGKSLFLSMLQHYYDINMADQFDTLFGDTYIGQNPTAKHNQFLVLTFDFSAVKPKQGSVEQGFDKIIHDQLEDYLTRYERFFTADELTYIREEDDFASKLLRTFHKTQLKQLDTYVFIDEYDNFTNTILSREGVETYHDITHDTGFYRHFFNILKAYTSGMTSGLARLFITGVSPVTMDDVTSGFNIGTNISFGDTFNAMIGFTDFEVHDLLNYYHEHGVLKLSVDATFDLMKAWYNNYHFAEDAMFSMFNSDMVLYFLNQVQGKTSLPNQLIDKNIRTDYSKLSYLMTVDRHIRDYLNHRQKEEEARRFGSAEAEVEAGVSDIDNGDNAQPDNTPAEIEPKTLNGNFSVLQRILADGEIVSPINDSFPVEELLSEQNFVSLLCYMGLLTFAGLHHGDPRLKIPNRTVKDLMYGYFRTGLKDVNIFKLNPAKLLRLLRDMAYIGEWRPFFEYINSEIQQQASVRDHLGGEKVFQGFLIAYLNVTHHFFTWSEYESGGGFVDLYLEPFVARFPDMNYGYLIELKYMSETHYRGKDGKKTYNEKIAEAKSQLHRYANDPRLQKYEGNVTFKKVALVYVGWKLTYAEEIP